MKVAESKRKKFHQPINPHMGEECSNISGLATKKRIHGRQKCSKYSNHGKNLSGNFTLLGADERSPPLRFFFHVSSLH